MTTNSWTIQDVLFPVVMWDVVAKPPEKRDEQQSLFDGAGLPASGHRAVVDVNRKRIFAVVSEGYDLVTNEDAIELGKKTFLRVFSQDTLDALELFNIVMPDTRSFCHVDFTVRGYDGPDSSDPWRPFLRVTNSYNRTRPLRFDFGFCRWICKNGMIFGAEQVRVQRYHTMVQGRTDWLSGMNLQTVKQIEVKFLEKMHNLRRYAVPEQMMLPLACKVLDIRVTEKHLASYRGRERVRGLGEHLEDLRTKYFSEMGHNGYAALNVLTDFASRPVVLAFSPASRVHILQERSGQWIDEFIGAIKKDDFNFDTYVKDYVPVADAIRMA